MIGFNAHYFFGQIIIVVVYLQVALGEADLALGCDQGGSIRIPSSWCGLVGKIIYIFYVYLFLCILILGM